MDDNDRERIGDAVVEALENGAEPDDVLHEVAYQVDTYLENLEDIPL